MKYSSIAILASLCIAAVAAEPKKGITLPPHETVSETEINSQIEPGVSDITKQVSAAVCDGIRVLIATHDVRPTYHDGPSRITANLRLDTVGQYTIHFQHPEGTNQPPISLVVGASADNPVTNTFKVYQGCPVTITNRQNDTLILEWNGLPGRGQRQNGWFFKGIKKQ
jgi:hypothetical protein